MATMTFCRVRPAGVMELLSEYNIDPSGKECVVVGRSNIVGKPPASFCAQKRYGDGVPLAYEGLKGSDTARRYLSCCNRKGEFITGDMIKEGAVVIDVGMNRNSAGKLVGDVHFESAAAKASYITPVPGGVGPMTRAVLMKNTIKAAQD